MIDVQKSLGDDYCAVCAKKIRKGHNFASITLKLLHAGDTFNMCLGCLGDTMNATKKAAKK